MAAVPSSAPELPGLCPQPCVKTNTAAGAWWHGFSQRKKSSSARAWFLSQTASGNRVGSKAKPEGPSGAGAGCRDPPFASFPLGRGQDQPHVCSKTRRPAAEGCLSREPRLSCPAGTPSFPRWGSPKMGADLEGRGEALGKCSGKISRLNSAVWDGKHLKPALPTQSPA